jgi:hypothetical protein
MVKQDAGEQQRTLGEFAADISRLASARCLTVTGASAKNFLVALGLRKYSNRGCGTRAPSDARIDVTRRTNNSCSVELCANRGAT